MTRCVSRNSKTASRRAERHVQSAPQSSRSKGPGGSNRVREPLYKSIGSRHGVSERAAKILAPRPLQEFSARTPAEILGASGSNDGNTHFVQLYTTSYGTGKDMKLTCYNCGSTEHSARGCTRPMTRIYHSRKFDIGRLCASRGRCAHGGCTGPGCGEKRN